MSDGELDVRLAAYNSHNKLFKMLVRISIVALVAIRIIYGKDIFDYVFYPWMAVACVFGYFYAREQERISALVKDNVVRGTLSEFFTECVYEPAKSLDWDTVASAQLVDDWHDYKGNDLIRGRYKGRAIGYSDVELIRKTSQVTRKGTRTVRTTVFNGQWMTCPLDKQLPAMLRIRERAERNGLDKKLLGERYKSKSDVEMDNPVFNDQFQILTADPHTAFYVLTPHFMEYILTADRNANGYTSLCFKDNMVHIAVYTNRDLFEVTDRKRYKDLPALRAGIRRETRYITNILDELFQNDYLFSKEKK